MLTFRVSLWLSVPFLLLASLWAEEKKPNIVLIYADDMGLGDVFHEGGKAPTPHLDRLAAQGMRFTDAHSPSAVCTPSRYSILTGRYSWRTRLKESVFFTPQDAPLISEGEETIASLAGKAGYRSACIGKWHLGLGWQFLPEGEKWPRQDGSMQDGLGWDIDYAKPLTITPLSHGFDYSYIIPASLDMAPYVFVENDRVVTPATVTKSFWRPGAAAMDFEAEDCLKNFTEKSVSFIEQSVEREQPFLLYLPLTSPHTPTVPREEWIGKSGIGLYGDFLMETDWVVGEVMQAVERLGVSEDTLIIFTADNGTSSLGGVTYLEEFGHISQGEGIRGWKTEIFEGGHRVPFIAQWPGVIPAGTVSDRLTCQTDLIATFAQMMGQELAADAGVDSESMLANLKDPAADARETAVVHHTLLGAFAIRQGPWKLVFGNKSGGWPDIPNWKYVHDWSEVAEGHRFMLFNLDEDLGETKNLEREQPELVEQMTALMQDYVDRGRSSKGEVQKNVGEVFFLPEDRERISKEKQEQALKDSASPDAK